MSVLSQARRLWQAIRDARRERLSGIISMPKPWYSREVWIADPAALDALIERSGCDALAADLRDRSLPCLYAFDAEPAASAPPGTTRFGGLPDLPPDTEWPQGLQGPLSFYAQLDLADLVASPIAGTLPASGLLSFFAGELDPPEPERIPVRVLFTPAGTPLTRRDAPAALEAFDQPHTALLAPVAARLEPGLSFPAVVDFDWLDKLEELPGGDTDALRDGLLPPFPILGQILGHAQWDENLAARIYFREIGRPDKDNLLLWKSWEDWERAKKIESRQRRGVIYRPWSADDDEPMRWILENRAAIDADIAQWRSLLSVETHHATGLSINDANAIYFFIRDDHLARGDFSQVRALTTQS